MNFIERYDTLTKIALHIRQENTGSLEELAQKCKIEKRTLSNLIDILRQLAARESAKIFYDRDKNSYYFSPCGKFTDFEFQKKIQQPVNQCFSQDD